MNYDRVRAAVRELLLALGEDSDHPDLQETPARAATAWAEFLGGWDEDPLASIAAIPAVESFKGQVIYLRYVSFRSVCEHPLLPFHGNVHLMYPIQRRCCRSQFFCACHREALVPITAAGAAFGTDCRRDYRRNCTRGSHRGGGTARLRLGPWRSPGGGTYGDHCLARNLLGRGGNCSSRIASHPTHALNR